MAPVLTFFQPVKFSKTAGIAGLLGKGAPGAAGFELS